MSFLLKPVLTLHLFGGIDVNWIGIIILMLAACAAFAVYYVRSKKELALKQTRLISAAIGVAGILASCGYSVAADATEAVKVERFANFFGLTFPVDRVALTLHIGDGFSIYWYGVIIAFGFMLAIIYGFKKAPSFNIDTDKMMDVILIGLIAAIICARAYYLMFDGVPMTSIKDFFAIHNGGIAIYGGVIGAFVFGGLTAKLRKINVLSMFDLASLGFLIGQGIGRWGNFVNQEVYGKPTGSEWFGISGSEIIADTMSYELVHPLFLYESIWCLATFFVLHRISKKRAFNGQITCLYMIIYGVGRFVFEGMRNTDFVLMFGSSISISQLVSVAAVVAGTVIYLLLLRRSILKVSDSYSSQFGEVYDDDDKLADAYGLFGVEFDSDLEAVKEAYDLLSERLNSMEVDSDEKKQKISAKLEEIKLAYEYIVKSKEMSEVQEEQ